MCTIHYRMCWIVATILIACSKLSNLGFIAGFVLSWCASLNKLNTPVVNRASSLKFELRILHNLG